MIDLIWINSFNDGYYVKPALFIYIEFLQIAIGCPDYWFLLFFRHSCNRMHLESSFRVFTSTNTIKFWFSAMISISCFPHFQFRKSILKPAFWRWSAARSSPFWPRLCDSAMDSLLYLDEFIPYCKRIRLAVFLELVFPSRFARCLSTVLLLIKRFSAISWLESPSQILKRILFLFSKDLPIYSPVPGILSSEWRDKAFLRK